MADSSADPSAQARLAKLEAELTALRQEFAGGLAAIEGAAAETKAAAAEVRAGRATTKAGAAAGILELSATEPAVVEKTTAGMEALAAAERDAAAAAAQRLGTELREVAAIKEATASLGGRAAVDQGSILAAAKRVEATQAETKAIEEQEAVLRGVRTNYLGPPLRTSLSPEEQLAAARAVQSASEPVRLAQALEPAGGFKPLPIVQDNSVPIERTSAALEAQKRAFASLDDSLTRHGALSTEFLSALARGQVTLSQFGTQIGQTIGKFAGWSGAAAGVYGALAALNSIREGAINTESAIQGLTRFIPTLDKAQASQQIQQQAVTTVTPIADVGNAAQSFARIFKDQGDVFTATHVALTASKLDNISLANSYRYLTALTQEYGLTAGQLPGIFDQVTAAQDRLGARVSELLPALARSAAAIKNTGGDLNQALALEALTIVRTGQTGNTIGTGFSRGASNFYKAPAAQATLAQFGINANQGFTQALIEAIDKGPKLSGDQKREISKAFFGPLRGGQLASLFNAPPEQVAKFVQQTSADSSRGLANRQLGIVTAQPDQRIKQIGIDLQALGAALGDSGLLTDLGVLISLLNSFLQSTTALLNAFGALPGGIKLVIDVLVPLAGALALAAKLNVVGPFGIGALSAFKSSEAALINTNISGLKGEQRGLGSQFRSAEIDVATAQNQKAVAATQEEQDRAALAEQNAIARREGIVARNITIQQLINAEEADLAALQSGNRGATLARIEAAKAGVSADAELAAATATVTAAMNEQAAAAVKLAAASDAAAAGNLAAGAGGAAGAAGRGALITEESVGIGAALGAAATRLKSFVFGPGGILLAGGAYAAFHGQSELNQQASQGVNAIDKGQTVQQVIAALNQAQNPQGIAAKLEQNISHPLSSIFGSGPFGEYQDAVQKEATSKINELGAQQDEYNAGLGRLNEIHRNLVASLGTAKSSFEKIGAIKQALADLGNDNALKYSDPSQFAAAKASLTKELDALSSSKNSIQNFLKGLKTPKDLASYDAETQGIFDIQGTGSKLGFERASATIVRLAELISNTSTPPADVAKYVADWKSLRALVKQNADTNEQSALALAGTDPTAQTAARSTYLDQITANTSLAKTNLATAETGLKTRQAQIANLRTAIAELDKGQGGLGGAIGLTASSLFGDGIKKLIDEAKGNKAQVTLLKQLLAQQELDLKVAQEEAHAADLAATTAYNNAKASYLQSLTQDPAAQAGIAVRVAQQNLAALIASGIKDPVQKFQDLQAIQAAQNQAIQAALSSYTSGLNLQTAQSDIGATQQTVLQNAVNQAKLLVAHIQSLGKKVSPDTLTQALIGLANAQAAITSFLQQQKLDQINSAFTLLESQTTNPLTIDREEIQHLQQLLALAKTKADRQNAQAKLNNANNKYIDDKVGARVDNINFELSIGEITTQQAELDIQNLLKMKDLSYARRLSLKQQLATLIHQGNAEASGFDLNVGNIKLPTAYDVRRAYGQAGQAIKNSQDRVVVTNNNTIDITATSKDAETAVYNAIDRLLSTQIRKAAKQAGLRH